MMIESNRVIHGEALEQLRTLPDACVDAVVTDPPAGIAFMGKDWDAFRRRHNPADVGRENVFGRTSEHAPHSYGESERGYFIETMRAIFTEALRTLKPGGHALVWALPRTSHWTATALEDAGFEIRDVVTHHFGSGFPKSHNLHDVWEGWGTALKPASEHWILCRKPLAAPTVAANVLQYGTGAINIDASRVGSDTVRGDRYNGNAPGGRTANTYGAGREHPNPWNVPAGRWPPNLVLSHSLFCVPIGERRVKANGSVSGKEPSAPTLNAYGEYQRTAFTAHGGSDGHETMEAWDCAPDCPVAALDRQSGTRSPGHYPVMRGAGGIATTGHHGQDGLSETTTNEGGASRYFPTFRYQAKASRAERNRGCEQINATPAPKAADYRPNDPDENKLQTRLHGSVARTGNHHPTVKSLGLMSWLIGLITPPNGLVLDPFAGSGSTLVAAKEGGWRYLGIEREAEYVAIAQARLNATRDPTVEQEAAQPALTPQVGDAAPITLKATPAPRQAQGQPRTQPKRRRKNGKTIEHVVTNVIMLSLFPDYEPQEPQEQRQEVAQ